ncbi:MAG: hypothetical protein HY875_12040 [Chloroflexi bacterium]|nr:hypothetical protein [Chloroflexota bacterium]
MSGGIKPSAGQRSLGADAGAVAYWVSLGVTAGGMGGLVAGGLGGRLAMFILRLTSDDSVRGLKSDDGFIIGRFDVTATLSLLFVTMVLGSLFGLFVVLGRQFLPSRGMPAAWAAAGAAVGGAVLIHGDGVDFTLIEPHWLAVALFILIPSAGGALIAWLTERLDTFWWKRRRATAVTSLAAVPAVIFFPVAVLAVAGGALWLLGGRIEGLRALPEWRVARVAAGVVFAGVVAVGGVALLGDLRDVL